MGQGGVTGRICPAWGVSPKGAKLESGQCHSLLAGPGQCHLPLGAGFMPSPPPSWGGVRSQESECPGVGTVLPLASHNVPPRV